MSDPYEREAAKAAIQTLERELAEVKNDLDFRRDLYKLQEMQLAEIAEQRDGLRAGIDYASDQLTKVKEQRDGLHELHNKNAARSKELLDLCGTLRKELTAVTKQRDRLAEALRKAISWADSASHHILHRQNINWTYLNEAKETLNLWEE